MPCQEGIEIGWVIWDLDQIPVKASACVECGVCLERCPFDVEIIDKMREAAVLFEAQAA